MYQIHSLPFKKRTTSDFCNILAFLPYYVICIVLVWRPTNAYFSYITKGKIERKHLLGKCLPIFFIFDYGMTYFNLAFEIGMYLLYCIHDFLKQIHILQNTCSRPPPILKKFWYQKTGLTIFVVYKTDLKNLMFRYLVWKPRLRLQYLGFDEH